MSCAKNLCQKAYPRVISWGVRMEYFDSQPNIKYLKSITSLSNTAARRQIVKHLYRLGALLSYPRRTSANLHALLS